MSALPLPRDAPETLRTGNRFRLATYGVASLGILVAVLVLERNPLCALAIAAILCGWSELDGLCGTSHVMALTPLRALDRGHTLWRKAVVAYTAGGIVTGACVGAILGALGQIVGLTPSNAFIPIVALALILIVREFRWINFRLPQISRQTERMWAMEFGFVSGAAMWGSHIGLGFATVVAHGGWFVLIGLALTLGPSISALLFAMYWLGRTLPIWMTPLFTSNDRDGGALGDLVLEHEAPYCHVAAAGIAIAAAVALALADSV